MIISVLSGKGGTGKDTMVSNLSHLLSDPEIGNKKVLLLDFDFGCCNLHYLYGVYPPLSLYDYLHKNKTFKSIKFPINEHLDLITAEQGKLELVDLTNKCMDEIIRDIRKEELNYDYIFINLSAGIHGTVMRFAMAADMVLSVITPNASAVTDGYHVIRELLKQDYPASSVYVLVNQEKDDRIGREVHARMNGVLKSHINKTVQYIGNIRRSDNIRAAEAAHKPFVSIYPKTHATRQLSRVKDILVAMHDKEVLHG